MLKATGRIAAALPVQPQTIDDGIESRHSNRKGQFEECEVVAAVVVVVSR